MDPDPILPYARPADPAGPTTARGAAAIVCRLIAVWLFAESAQGLAMAVASLVTSLVNYPNWQRALSYGLISLAMAAGPVAAGWLVWVASGSIARRVVPDDAPISVAGNPDLRPLLTVGLVVAGASVAAWSVRDLVGAAVVASQSHVTFALWWHDVNWLRAFISDVVVLGLALWLVLGGRGVVDLVHRARTAGQPVPDHGGSDR